MVNDSDDEVIFIGIEDSGGKCQAITTTDHCGGRESNTMSLLQASIKSYSEVVKIRTQNIHDSILKQGKWDVSEHKACATLPKNLTKDILSPVPSAKRDYDPSTLKYLQILKGMKNLATPDKAEKLREHIQDAMS